MQEKVHTPTHLFLMSFYQLKLPLQACLCFNNFSNISLHSRLTSSIEHYNKEKILSTSEFMKKNIAWSPDRQLELSSLTTTSGLQIANYNSLSTRFYSYSFQNLLLGQSQNKWGCRLAVSVSITGAKFVLTTLSRNTVVNKLKIRKCVYSLKSSGHFS
jgi:hypothetical protein